MLLSQVFLVGEKLPSYTFMTDVLFRCMLHFIKHFFNGIRARFLGVRDTRTREEDGCDQREVPSHYLEQVLREAGFHCARRGMCTGRLAEFKNLGWRD